MGRAAGDAGASTSATPPVGTVRPGGRAARVRAAVMRAVLEQLGQHGFNGISVDDVAAAAGVHRTTVYRRWPDRATLLRDALAEGLEPAVSVPDTGDIDADVVSLAREIAQVLSDPQTASATRAMASTVPPVDLLAVVEDYWARRLSVITARLDTAVADGQLPPGSDSARAVVRLAAPLFFQLLVERRPIDDSDAIAAARDALVLLRHG